MSPEQAEGRKLLDHRTDIYSLGVTLYELLTLRPAFHGEDRQQLLRQIEDQEPPLPRSVDFAIPKDMETIILKAIAKQAPDRYDSASALAEADPLALDVRCTLSEAHRMLGQTAVDVHRAARESQRAVELMEQVVAQAPTVPEFQLQLNVCRCFLAGGLQGRGALDDAELLLGATERSSLLLARQFPKNHDYWSFWAFNRSWLADLHIATGRFEDAEVELRGALETYALHAPFVSEDIIEYRTAEAACAGHLGQVLYALRRPRDAETHLRKAVVKLEGVVAGFPSLHWARQELSWYLLLLSDVLLAQGRVDEAEAAIRSCLKNWEYADVSTQHSDMNVEGVSEGEFRLGLLLWRVGRQVESRRLPLRNRRSLGRRAGRIATNVD
jgi:tetratricopeptide (TPR) repeat protein